MVRDWGLRPPFLSARPAGRSPRSQVAGPADLYKGARPQVAGPQNKALVSYGIVLYTEDKPGERVTTKRRK